MGSAVVLQLGSTFVCQTLTSPLRNVLGEADVEAVIRVTAPEELSQHMLAPAADSEDIAGTLVLVRVEDWLRDSGEATDDKAARAKLKAGLDEFLGQVSVLAMRGRPVWLLICPSAGWIAEKNNFTALCRTYTNLLAARLRSLPQITLLTWPESLARNEFYDREQDRTNHIPFTAAAFDQLAESVARQLVPKLSAGNTDAVALSASAGSPELANFLSGLRVQVKVAVAQQSDSTDVGRILRSAASFSLAGERPTLSDSEAEAIVASQECWLVRVSDRLSDLGASGVITAQAQDGALVVKALSLSCTVLGKQVEYALLGALKQIALARNLPTVAFEYHDSGRNQPALSFLRSIANEKNAQRYELPAEEVEARVENAAVAPGAWTATVEI